ncbi:hypothetical protein COCCADRAFT_27533 [Bipolaris zeicola 26-R-13]|uniref:Uncharacterized protein n=1 Tax=Cochliobolus carbonum (strain 26-R-13) TaxID=930089 RepID=W6Y2K9_COCC2|nr:uncharacterized protein COCCADRAFT_27533 [Bipolaris zeicola 26-R-13]EUC31860.1 hypothetical protein COCCADRAFT_27533 [Bipolaris zeicola 26-R-13]
MLFLELRKKSSKRRGYRKMRPPKPKRLVMAAKQAAAAQEEADAAAAAESSSVAFDKPITRREEEDKDEQEPDLPTNKDKGESIKHTNREPEYKYIDDDDGEHQDRVNHCGVTAQLIFQFNKVCPEIIPTNLRNFRGLGGITTFDGQDFLNHLKERKAIPDIARMLEILAYISNFKNSDGGNQDRNTLPPDDLTTPKEHLLLLEIAVRKNA